MKRTTEMKYTIIMGLVLGSFFYGFLLGGSYELEGYRVERRAGEFITWTMLPIMDMVEVHGDPDHPALFRLALSTSEGIELYLELYNGYDLQISEQSLEVLQSEMWINSTQEISFMWGVSENTISCGFSCPVKYELEVWEWDTLMPQIEEWALNESE